MERRTLCFSVHDRRTQTGYLTIRNEKADEIARQQGASSDESEAVEISCPQGVRKSDIL